MNGKIKGILIIVFAAVIGTAGFAGFGYIRQKTVANEGISYLKNKQYQKAYEKFHDASGKFTLVWTDQKTDVLFYEGEALYELERYDEAIKVYNRLIEKDESRAYSFQAFCYMGKGDEAKAMKVCEAGIRELPEAGDIYCTGYAILAKQEKYEEGLQILEKALQQEELNSKKDVLFTRISAYESMLDYEKAHEYAEEYVKAYPNDAQGKKELTFLETR
jgi:tetratricopeptide (TPR) repeat protein